MFLKSAGKFVGLARKERPPRLPMKLTIMTHPDSNWISIEYGPSLTDILWEYQNKSLHLFGILVQLLNPEMQI